MTRTRAMTWLLLLCVAVLVLWLLGRTGWRMAQAAQLARASEPLQHTSVPAQMRLLIVGDSTAVGTGASAPSHSLAGLIAHAYPRLQIDNRAQDGATWADLMPQLEGDRRFDVVLIQAGGNDVIRLRDLDQAGRDIHRVLARARERADAVLVMPAGNVGNAPFFFPPWSWWMTARARTLHAHVKAAAARHGAVYVDLFEEREDDPFVQRPGLHAADGLHPSDAGYRLWWDELRAQSDLTQRLAPAAPR